MGRLIDADKLRRQIHCEYSDDLGILEIIDAQPTVYDMNVPLEAYCIVNFEVRKGFVYEVTYSVCRKPLFAIRYDDNSLECHRGYLGISVFFTKSEAEEKLGELRSRREVRSISSKIYHEEYED